jgi:hypothetical protein
MQGQQQMRAGGTFNGIDIGIANFTSSRIFQPVTGIKINGQEEGLTLGTNYTLCLLAVDAYGNFQPLPTCSRCDPACVPSMFNV